MNSKLPSFEDIRLHGIEKQSLRDLIEQSRFDYVNPDIVIHFSDEKQILGEISCRAFVFEEAMGSDEVNKTLEASGYQPASIFELVRFSIQSPNFQRKIPIVALGSSWAHSEHDGMVPALWGGDKSRELNMCSRSTHWFEEDAFLAKKKTNE